MTRIQALPAPNDSYDHKHSTEANASSLRAMFASFDAAFDALHDEIQSQVDRVEALSQTAAEIRARSASTCTSTNAGHVENDNDALEFSYPATHDAALNLNVNGTTNKIPMKESIIARAREASNTAIRGILREEALRMEVSATPSDLWLDQPCAFNQSVAAECQLAVEMHSVPPILVNNSVKVSGGGKHKHKYSNSNSVTTVNCEEAHYYREEMKREKLKMDKKEHQKKDDDGDRYGDGDGDGDGESITSDFSRLSVYSTLSHGTASHRRHQRKLKAAQRQKIKEQNSNLNVGSENSNIAGENFMGMGGTGRQQLLTGSLPYVCVMLHDSYGVGASNDPLYRPVESINDLLLCGSEEMAYTGTFQRKVGTSSGNGNNTNRRRRSRDDNLRKEKKEEENRIKKGTTMTMQRTSSDLFEVKEEEDEESTDADVTEPINLNSDVPVLQFQEEEVEFLQLQSTDEEIASRTTTSNSDVSKVKEENEIVQSTEKETVSISTTANSDLLEVKKEADEIVRSST